MTIDQPEFDSTTGWPVLVRLCLRNLVRCLMLHVDLVKNTLDTDNVLLNLTGSADDPVLRRDQRYDIG